MRRENSQGNGERQSVSPHYLKVKTNENNNKKNDVKWKMRVMGGREGGVIEWKGLVLITKAMHVQHPSGLPQTHTSTLRGIARYVWVRQSLSRERAGLAKDGRPPSMSGNNGETNGCILVHEDQGLFVVMETKTKGWIRRKSSKYRVMICDRPRV